MNDLGMCQVEGCVRQQKNLVPLWLRRWGMLSIEESALALVGILRPFRAHAFPRSGQAFQKRELLHRLDRKGADYLTLNVSGDYQ